MLYIVPAGVVVILGLLTYFIWKYFADNKSANMLNAMSNRQRERNALTNIQQRTSSVNRPRDSLINSIVGQYKRLMPETNGILQEKSD